MLTLSLVNVEGKFNHLEDQVAHEAAALNDFDRTLTRYGDDRLTALRPLLMRYARAIAGPEWLLLHEGKRSLDIDTIYAEISKALRQIEPESQRQQLAYAEALHQFDDLSDLRDERIDAAIITLPLIYWFTTLAMISLMVVLAAINRPTIERTMITVVIAAVIGLLLALVFVFDAPFQGSGAIAPTPFEFVMEQMAARK